jgi:hypothetical protein
MSRHFELIPPNRLSAAANPESKQSTTQRFTGELECEFHIFVLSTLTPVWGAQAANIDRRMTKQAFWP